MGTKSFYVPLTFCYFKYQPIKGQLWREDFVLTLVVIICWRIDSLIVLLVIILYWWRSKYVICFFIMIVWWSLCERFFKNQIMIPWNDMWLSLHCKVLAWWLERITIITVIIGCIILTVLLPTVLLLTILILTLWLLTDYKWF